MTQYNGNEFQNERGTQGALLGWIWGKIYTYFNGVYNGAVAYVNTALGNVYTKPEIDTKVATLNSGIFAVENGLQDELVARANGDTVLQSALNALTAQVVGLKTITPWDANSPFPTVRSDGAAFSRGNYVQITVGNENFKAGDMLICTSDGANNIAAFGDIDSNVDIATDTVFGTVKLIASLAEYNGVDAATGAKVITKSVLQAILTQVTAAITTAYTNADSALQAAITAAYQSAISAALANVYTKAEIDTFLGTINTNVASLQAAVAVLQGNVSALQTSVATKVSGIGILTVMRPIEQVYTNGNYIELVDFGGTAEDFYYPDGVLNEIIQCSLRGVELCIRKVDRNYPGGSMGQFNDEDDVQLDMLYDLQNGQFYFHPSLGNILGAQFSLRVLSVYK